MRNAGVEHNLSTDLAPVLGARRDGTANAESSRGLLMTMLGEFVLPTGGAAWTRTLIAGFDLLGVQEKAARQALSRMEGDGWLARERHGRQTRWSLTARAERLLRDGAERIYGFGHAARPWDGEWVVLLASVPEPERATRYRMAQQLSWIGFGPLGHGTWICPWTAQEEAARRIVADLDIDATSFRGPVGLVGSGPALTARAWPMDDLADVYRQFLADFPSGDRIVDGATVVCDLSRLVHRWRRFPFMDPDLPAELLPDRWPGREATERFAGLRQAWLEPAHRWWNEQEAGFG